MENIVGSKSVSTSEAVCQSYQFTCFIGKEQVMKPDMVVLAETTKQVSEILKAANEYKVPVTPKGAVGGGGLGGTLQGGILLDLSPMEKIIHLDVDNMKVIAEAGCSFFKLAQELFKKGLMLPTAEYGPGPSVAASAITPANGFGKTRYGPNIDLVEGFEVVLPSGEITTVGSMAYANSEFGPFYRYITGPDLVGLFTKSNGAFGIVTKVAYRCLHLPEHWSFYSYYWPLDRIEDVAGVLMEATAIEVFDAHITDKWRAAFMTPRELPKDCHFIVLFAVNAENELEMKGKVQAIEDICRKRNGTAYHEIADEFYSEWPTEFFGLARPIPEENVPNGRYMYIFDELIYPTSSLPDVYTKMMELTKKYGIWGGAQFSVFDGFPMKAQVMSSQTWAPLDNNDPHWDRQFHECQREFREWFGAKGGLFQTKFPPLVPEHCWTNQVGAFELLRNLKKLLDPNGILSPGSFEYVERLKN